MYFNGFPQQGHFGFSSILCCIRFIVSSIENESDYIDWVLSEKSGFSSSTKKFIQKIIK